MEDQIILISISKTELKALTSEAVQQALHQAQTSSPSETDEALIKISEVADLLRVSEVTIHQLKKAGKIPFPRMGKRVYFKRGEVMDALKRIESGSRGWK